MSPAEEESPVVRETDPDIDWADPDETETCPLFAPLPDMKVAAPDCPELSPLMNSKEPPDAAPAPAVMEIEPPALLLPTPAVIVTAPAPSDDAPEAIEIKPPVAVDEEPERSARAAELLDETDNSSALETMLPCADASAKPWEEVS